MEESPKLIGKRPARLSLRRGRLSESPKTPGRIIASSDCLNTSPSIRPADVQNSTPLNRHKRTCFAEESPSQDYDSPHQQMTLSQDIRQNAVDVDWKWEEQCPKVKPIAKPIPHRILDPMKLGRPSRKAILRNSPECVQKKGFYKFKEELLQNMHTDPNRSSSVLEDITENELDSSLKENDLKIPLKNPVSTKETKSMKFQQIETKLPPKNRIKPKETTIVPETVIDQVQTNLLDDSDLDSLLLQCSQKAEATYHNQIKRKKIQNDSSFNRPDSIDELLLSLPLDEKFDESPHPVDSKPPPQPSTSEPSSNSNAPRSPLIRHNSMPTRSPIVKCPPQRPVICLMRHNSMPTKNKEPERSSALSSSSTESVVSDGDKRLCTSEEIQRKRLEAIQRREASRQRKASIFVKNAMNIRSNLLKPNTDKSPPSGDNNQQATSSELSSNSNASQCRSPLIRHNSMPTRSPIAKCPPQRPVISFMRHNSMPTKNMESERSSGLSSSSTDPVVSVSEGDKRLCTSEEIQRKRLEAIQRREASKQKNAVIFVQNSMNIRSNLLNPKTDKR